MPTPSALIPNIINANAFYVQADARDGRFTWQYEGAQYHPYGGTNPAPNVDPGRWTSPSSDPTGKLINGLVIAGRPSLQYPLAHDAAGQAQRDAIDAAATQDDVMAWAWAARWWVSFAWLQYTTSQENPYWKQVSEWGSVDPATLLPTMGSTAGDVPQNPQLANATTTFGALEILAGGSDLSNLPWLFTSSWDKYFASLVAQIVLKSVQMKVSALIQIQMAMRQVAWWMGSNADGLETYVSEKQQFDRGGLQFKLAGVCTIAQAWNAGSPAPACK